MRSKKKMSKRKIVWLSIALALIVGFVLLIVFAMLANKEEPGHEHDWTAGSRVIREATSKEYGLIEYSCTCGEKTEQYTPKLDHDHAYTGDWLHNRANHWHACDKQGCTVLRDKAAHTYDEGVIITEANQNIAGTKRYTCTVCQYSYVDNYSVKATVTREEWAASFSASLFENVTYFIKTEKGSSTVEASVKVANGMVEETVGGVTITYENNGDALYGTVSLCQFLERFVGEYDNYFYHSETRAYTLDQGGVLASVQYSNGHITRVTYKDAEGSTVIELSAYGRTEIQE
jgi:hypothetical protein